MFSWKILHAIVCNLATLDVEKFIHAMKILNIFSSKYEQGSDSVFSSLDLLFSPFSNVENFRRKIYL